MLPLKNSWPEKPQPCSSICAFVVKIWLNDVGAKGVGLVSCVFSRWLTVASETDWVTCCLLPFFSPSQKWNVLIRNKISSIHQLSKREFTGYQLFVNKLIHVHPHKIKLVCIKLMARSSCDGHDASNQWYGSRQRCKSNSCLTIDDVDADSIESNGLSISSIVTVALSIHSLCPVPSNHR